MSVLHLFKSLFSSKTIFFSSMEPICQLAKKFLKQIIIQSWKLPKKDVRRFNYDSRKTVCTNSSLALFVQLSLSLEMSDLINVPCNHEREFACEELTQTISSIVTNWIYCENLEKETASFTFLHFGWRTKNSGTFLKR